MMTTLFAAVLRLRDRIQAAWLRADEDERTHLAPRSDDPSVPQDVWHRYWWFGM